MDLCPVGFDTSLATTREPGGDLALGEGTLILAWEDTN